MSSYNIETWQRISEKMIETQWKKDSLWTKPAFQVVILTNNNEETITPALESVEKSIKNFHKDCKWILQIGDNESEDQSLLKISQYALESSADKIHLYDFDKEEKRGVNENKLIKELHKYGEEYPAVLFMEAGGEMLEERPMMFYTAASYNAPYVVGGWASKFTDNYKSSDDAAYKLQFGPWATLFHISALPKDGKFFYETINKGRDVLAWTQMRYIEDKEPVAHVRSEDIVHIYDYSDIENKNNTGTSLLFQKQEITNEAPEPNMSFEEMMSEQEQEEENKNFLNMKSQLESRHDILKYVAQ